MPAIKSAIELAMERTNNLIIDENDKYTIYIKHIENKIKAILRRYREHIINIDDIDKEMMNVEADESLRKSILIDLLIDKLDVSNKNEILFDLLCSISAGLKKPFNKEMETLRRSFIEDKKEIEKTVREKIMNHLKESGIEGNGIEPNIMAWDEWNASLNEAGLVLKQQLNKWRDRLKKADSSVFISNVLK